MWSDVETDSLFLPPAFKRNGEGTAFTGVCLFTFGRYPHQADGGTVPSSFLLRWGGRYSHARSGQDEVPPHQDWNGVAPPVQDWMWVPP